MFKSAEDGSLYVGDMRIGDRAATSEEIEADRISKLPAPLTKQQRITAAEEAICAPYKLTRTAIQMIVALANMRAELKFEIDGTPVEDTLADSFVRNKTYRIAKTLENACIAAVAAIV